MTLNIDCFKAYDIRGQIPNQLNPDVAYRIGNATAEYLSAKRMVVGRDIRLSSEELTNAVCKGLTDAGVEVLDIGLGGTEMVYFATADLKADGGIMVTASHNPADYNGLKLVREEARPISGDTGLEDIRKLAEQDERQIAADTGNRVATNVFDAYVEHLLTYVDSSALKPLKLVVNPGNGGAGIAMDGLKHHLPFEFVDVNYEPDGTFPNGIPNPMLLENQEVTSKAVVEHKADMGIAWDGDFDRCATTSLVCLRRVFSRRTPGEILFMTLVLSGIPWISSMVPVVWQYRVSQAILSSRKKCANQMLFTVVR